MYPLHKELPEQLVEPLYHHGLWHLHLILIYGPIVVWWGSTRGSRMVKGLDCMEGWSNTFQLMEHCSPGQCEPHMGGHCDDTLHEHAGMLSLFISTKVLEGATLVLCIEDNVRILKHQLVGPVWMDLHLEHRHLIMSHHSPFVVICLFCWTAHGWLLVCQVQPHGHLWLAVFASSVMNGFHLNNPHINWGFVCCC
jgi:hypothetical protein